MINVVTASAKDITIALGNMALQFFHPCFVRALKAFFCKYNIIIVHLPSDTVTYTLFLFIINGKKIFVYA